MRCFYLPGVKYCNGAVINLPTDLRKHIKTVLRLQPESEIQVFDGCGLLATAVLQDNDTIKFCGIMNSPAPPCSLTLIQGMPKGDKLELILQKGTELGINQFNLTPMARSVGQLKDDRKRKRLERWQKIINAAASQSRQYYLPQLNIDTSFANTLTTVEADLKLILWEESAEPLTTVLPAINPQKIAVVVGPEGGITQQEADLAMAAGYRSVSLGPRILRTETAGLAIMAVLQYLYGDLTTGKRGS